MSVAQVVETNSRLYLDWLTQACSIPSLASEPAGLTRMATWLQDRFDELGGAVERLSYEDSPDALLVTLGSGTPTVLVYDHYDVQPVDPLDLWRSDPFAPEIRDGRFYARGAADNKGDLVARIAGLHAYAEVNGSWPCNIKFLIEGEEETGSTSFEQIVARHGDRLAADGCIWEGEGVDHAGRGKVVLGAKGLAYVELISRGLADDQHSSLAVIAPSPVWHLVEAISSLRSPEGRVLIDGFYDDVRPPGEDDLALLEGFQFDEAAERERLGVDRFVAGATGTELLRRYYFEPTCNIAGIIAGFTEPGTSKTVLPKEARCKIDMRLVPDQDPHEIVVKLRAHLDALGFEDIAIETFSMEHPVRSPMDARIGRAAIEAAAGIYDDVSVAPMMIGTGPMYPIAATLGIPTVSPAGVCDPSANIHAPNESCLVREFLRTATYTAAWLEVFAAT